MFEIEPTTKYPNLFHWLIMYAVTTPYRKLRIGWLERAETTASEDSRARATASTPRARLVASSDRSLSTVRPRCAVPRPTTAAVCDASDAAWGDSSAVGSGIRATSATRYVISYSARGVLPPLPSPKKETTIWLHRGLEFHRRWLRRGNRKLPRYSPRNRVKHQVLPPVPFRGLFWFLSDSAIIALIAFTKCSHLSVYSALIRRV